MLSIIFAYRLRNTPQIYDPVDPAVGLTSYFTAHYQTREIGVFRQWLTNGDPFANATHYFEGPTGTAAPRDSRGVVQFFNGIYSDAAKINFYGFGKHFYVTPDTVKGVISYRNTRTYVGEFPYSNISAELQAQAEDPNQGWPNTDQLFIDPQNIENVKNNPQYSTADCYFDFYYTMRYSVIPAKGNTFLDDIEQQMVTYENLRNGSIKVVALQGELVSNLCATRFSFEGAAQNTAFTLMHSYYFAVPMTICCLLSLISTARLLYLSNSTVRIQRISFYSMLLQTVYDFAIGMIYIQVMRHVTPVYKHMCVLSFICFLQAFLFDLKLMGKAFVATLQLQGQRFNPRVLNRCIIAFYIVVFIYIFVQRYIPKWVVFLLIVLASSYWFIQSYHSFRYNQPGKPLPFDYLIIQSIIKFVPIIYFYGYENNFTQYEVHTWQLIVATTWSGLQLLIILIQYWFGNRLCFNHAFEKSTSNAYKYDEQKISERVILDSPEFISPEQLVDEYAGFLTQGGTGTILEFIYGKGFSFIIPFQSTHSDAPSGALNAENEATAKETPVSALSGQSRICMNPLHRHSLFYQEDCGYARVSTLFPPIKRVTQEPTYSSCFYIAQEKSLANFVTCSICIDSIELDHITNLRVLSIFNTDEEALYLKRTFQTSSQALFITPCGHCFHKECLQRWASENLQCPVDRQPIPPCGQVVWYE